MSGSQGLAPPHLALLPPALFQSEEPQRSLVSPQRLTSPAEQCAGALWPKASDIKIPFLGNYSKETIPQECTVGGSKILSTTQFIMANVCKIF